MYPGSLINRRAITRSFQARHTTPVSKSGKRNHEPHLGYCAESCLKSFLRQPNARKTLEQSKFKVNLIYILFSDEFSNQLSPLLELRTQISKQINNLSLLSMRVSFDIVPNVDWRWTDQLGIVCGLENASKERIMHAKFGTDLLSAPLSIIYNIMYIHFSLRIYGRKKMLIVFEFQFKIQFSIFKNATRWVPL